MGTVLPFETIHLYHLNLENFLHRHPPLEDAQGDSGNFSGGKMDPQEIVHQVIAYLKEQIPIAAFTIGKDAQIVRLSRKLVQCLYCLFQEPSVLLATASLPDESTGSIHEQDGPSRRLIWRDMLLDLGRGFIAFDHPG